jgi:hypothetical protein
MAATDRPEAGGSYAPDERRADSRSCTPDNPAPAAIAATIALIYSQSRKPRPAAKHPMLNRLSIGLRKEKRTPANPLMSRA